MGKGKFKRVRWLCITMVLVKVSGKNGSQNAMPVPASITCGCGRAGSLTWPTSKRQASAAFTESSKQNTVVRSCTPKKQKVWEGPHVGKGERFHED